MEDRHSKRLSWVWAGVLLGILNAVLMSSFVSSRPIGASTAFPYVGAILSGLGDGLYAHLIAGPGLWEVWFLAGALIGAVVSSVAAGDFKLRLIPDRWRERKGGSPGQRILWTTVGAFLLILGARLAGGCTSGHILSGIMQFSASSLVFGGVVMVTTIATGRLFYGR